MAFLVGCEGLYVCGLGVFILCSIANIFCGHIRLFGVNVSAVVGREGG